MSSLSLGRAPTFALLNAIALLVGSRAAADDSEAPRASARVLFSGVEWAASPVGADADPASLGIQKGLGVAIVKPLELNDHKYELGFGGPFLKSGTKHKSLGLKFELRF